MSPEFTRRTFLQSAAAAAAAIGMNGGAYAAGSDVIRIGVIGCGGRGTGAALDALRGSEGVEIVALGDLAPDRLSKCRETLASQLPKYPGTAVRYKVTDATCFTGFDSYQKVIATDVHLVILASPPGFRPAHLAAAVAAGKHIFTEKPVAVDAAGIRSVLATYDLSVTKGLGIGVGTQRRHDAGYVTAMKRIHDGAIGDVLSGQVFWNQGGLWNRDRQPEWTDAEWQIRNWLYFTWLSGDHIVEQHVHNIDVVNWAKQAHPVRALALGGRQVRTGSDFGHIFDHFAVDYEYADGTPLMSMCRQIGGCDNSVSESLAGEKGTCQVDKYAIAGAKAWKFPDRDNRPYVQEHTDFIAAIRKGAPYNELKDVAESTLTAIMGRMSAYTGKTVTWEQALNSKETLMPSSLALGSLPMPPVPMPGQTALT
jgi:predicted dehydrogenase